MMQTNNHTALLIIDVQKGLFMRKTPIFRERRLLNNISTLISRAHASGVQVIFVQHANKTQLVRDSDNWQLHPRLSPAEGDIFIDKHWASAFKGTNLKNELARRSIKNLVIAGLATHLCVRATCLDAKKMGFAVVLAKDGHSNFNMNAWKLISEWNEKLSLASVKVKMTKDITFNTPEGGRMVIFG